MASFEETVRSIPTASADGEAFKRLGTDYRFPWRVEEGRIVDADGKPIVPDEALLGAVCRMANHFVFSGEVKLGG